MASARSRLRRQGVALCFAVASLLSLLSASAVEAAFPGWNGRIAYSHCVDGAGCSLWAMDADGGNAGALTYATGVSEPPAYSADGQRMTYSHCAAGCGVEVANSDGSGATELTTSGDADIFDGHPALSPDGQTVVFSRCVLHGDCTIWSIDSSGGPATQLTTSPNGIWDLQPVFSPDGSKIAFLHGGRIDFMNPDGSGEVPFASTSDGMYQSPTFSPDGTRVAFQQLRFSTPSARILVAPVTDGSSVTALTDPVPEQSDGEPAFSPDGTLIAFVRSFQVNFQPMGGSWVTSSVIASVPAQGGQPTMLTSGAVFDSAPAWEFGPPPTTTPPAIPKAPIDGMTPTDHPIARIARVPGFPSHRVKAKRGNASVLLSCPANVGGPCAGTLTLEAKLARAGTRRSRVTTVGMSRFNVPSGQIGVVSVRLSRTAKLALKSHRRLVATAKLTLVGGGASSTTLKLG